MRAYLKYIRTFLRASLISLLFGACWVITFYGFDEYAVTNLKHLKNDFFFDIVLFFLSGLVGAFLFYLIMLLLGKLNTSFTK
ncbi:hypothetical protein [uncultured Kordia sp.]|uniref:hypothetical protein n=1 Tax=uncultured Kordia sp. TaxID=507699 RepID=UPI00262201D5|nr:hypothetical protein [uncultured Kordia sp.]